MRHKWLHYSRDVFGATRLAQWKQKGKLRECERCGIWERQYMHEGKFRTQFMRPDGSVLTDWEWKRVPSCQGQQDD